jgi:hypothetical protein
MLVSLLGVKKNKASKKIEIHQLQERENPTDHISIAATELGSLHSEETAVHGQEHNEESNTV